MESTIVAVGKESIFAISIKKLLGRPSVAVTPEVVSMAFTWIIMQTNAIFSWILSEISSSGKKKCSCEQKIHTMAISLQPIRYQNNKCKQVWH